MSKTRPKAVDGPKWIHGSVTFTTQKDGRLVSSQERGYDGKRWIESLLVYYGLFYSGRELRRVCVRAQTRVDKSESRPKAANARKRKTT